MNEEAAERERAKARLLERTRTRYEGDGLAAAFALEEAALDLGLDLDGLFAKALAFHKDELVGLEARLRALRPAEFIRTWLETPLPVLDGASPFELIQRGELERVQALVSDLEYPGAS